MTTIISTLVLPEEGKKLLSNFNVIEKEFTQEDLRRAEVLLAWPKEVSQLIDNMERLKIIQTFSAGVDDLPFQKIKEKEIKVFSNAGAYSVSVAEHAWALILTLAKGTNIRKRRESYPITGKTILILGAGGIGSEVAKIAKNGFSMRVIGASRSFKGNYDVKIPLNEVDKYIGDADVIVDTLPLNKFTKDFLNYERLTKTKQKVIIVNVGRGETVNKNDIEKILKERPDLRFGTDVFWRNDKEDFDVNLWSLDNFAGTLHVGGGYASQEILYNAINKACENLSSYLKLGKADNEVNINDYLG
ncbi:NAD(P)-dependent oxidoreductase [Candidatus Acidianus copahuensis]|uniref:NAD(P)-dependent oxidoreductase n=1 Tax=Candidatus Acidianus copahuensis TaxID=1160895 RepID=UPI00064FA86B|nr:NAD(P)-dependent oxidoreductase [Candidatus Acidianus copahuensis]